MLRHKNLGILFTRFCNSKRSALKAIWAEAVFDEIHNANSNIRHENPLVDYLLKDMKLSEDKLRSLKSENYK